MAGRLAVIGAGLMGSGIAQVAAQAGWAVVLRDVDHPSVERGTAAIRGSLERFAAKGTIAPGEVDAILARITGTTDLDAAGDADIVVEAVFERLDVKRDVFRSLDGICKADAVLATNTSAIPVTQIASVTRRPESVVGTHFFSPVPMMALCELVRGYKTSDATLDRVRRFAEEIGKTCIVVNRDIAGFVTTRLIAALVVEAVKLVESGVVVMALGIVVRLVGTLASDKSRDPAVVVEAVKLYESGVATAEDIDTACRLGFGHAMGPLATTDLTGADVLMHATRNIYDETADEKFFPPELLARMVAAGDLGRKTGRGFYSYEKPGSPVVVDDPGAADPVELYTLVED